MKTEHDMLFYIARRMISIMIETSPFLLAFDAIIRKRFCRQLCTILQTHLLHPLYRHGLISAGA